MVIKDGVDFDSLDDEPVNLLFLIAAPNTEDNIHLDVLSKLSMLLMDENFVEKLKNASSVDEFLEIVDAADEEKPDLNDQLAAQTETEGSVCRIIAVTSCPTGIAHTYMAAEGLEKAAKSHNCSIKVETRGSGGAKNVLTDEEIANADCVIVAADAKVPMDRFDGKKLIEVPVSDGISKADQLVERAINGDAPIYHSSNAGSQSTASKKASGGIGHRLYVHLMNGVSHMLPFVVGGGILIAIAFLYSGIIVLISVFAKDTKEANSYIMPVYMLILILGIATMFTTQNIESWYYAVPVFNTALALQGILTGDVSVMQYAVTLAETLILGMILITVIAKAFESEKVMAK